MRCSGWSKYFASKTKLKFDSLSIYCYLFNSRRWPICLWILIRSFWKRKESYSQYFNLAAIKMPKIKQQQQQKKHISKKKLRYSWLRMPRWKFSNWYSRTSIKRPPFKRPFFKVPNYFSVSKLQYSIPLLNGQPLLSGQFPKSWGWLLNRGPTVPCFPLSPPIQFCLDFRITFKLIFEKWRGSEYKLFVYFCNEGMLFLKENAIFESVLTNLKLVVAHKMMRGNTKLNKFLT